MCIQISSQNYLGYNSTKVFETFMHFFNDFKL